MLQLVVDPDTLDERASQTQEQGTNMENVIASLNNLILTLEGEWKGLSASEYINRYNEMKPNFNSMKDLIFDLAGYLHRKADEYRTADGR